MKCIAVFGRKGGSGKTQVSHFLSHGLAMCGYPTIMLQTDVRAGRPPEFLDGRNYMLASTLGEGGDVVGKIEKIIEQARRLPGSVLVIDGGANRRNVDLAFAPLADLILIPTGYSPEDIAVAQADYEEFAEEFRRRGRAPEVYIVMNRWPGLYRKLTSVKGRPWIRDFFRDTDKAENRFPYYIPDMPSLLDMAHGEAPRYTPLIDGKSRSFASLVALKIGLTDEIPEPMSDDEDDDDGSSSAPPMAYEPPRRAYGTR